MKRLLMLTTVALLSCGAPEAQPRLHNSVQINACYKIRNGQLRLAAISSDGTLFCRRNELPIQWPAVCPCTEEP